MYTGTRHLRLHVPLPRLLLCVCVCGGRSECRASSYETARLEAVLLQHMLARPCSDCDALISLYPYPVHLTRLVSFFSSFLNLPGNTTMTFSFPPVREWQKPEIGRDLRDSLTSNTLHYLNLGQLVVQPVFEQTIMSYPLHHSY